MRTYHYLIAALNELAPDKGWTFENEDIQTLTWLAEYDSVPTIVEIIAKAKELENK